MKKILILALLTASALAQTPVTPLPNPKIQFLSSAGVPLAGGKVCTFSSGTTSPLTTYSEATGSSANTNPITLDSGGFATIFVTSSAIKLIVYSSVGADSNCPNSGVSQYTVDGIAPAKPVAPMLLTAIADPAVSLGNFWLSSTNVGRIKWSDGSAIHTVVGVDTTDTLSNKTLASPVVTGTLAAASETLSGLLTNYNGIATVKNGVSAEYATVDLGSQSADIGTSTAYAVPVSGAGLYRVSVYIVVNRAATNSSTLPAVQIAYTDSDSSGVITQATATSTGNTTSTAMQSTFIINAKASTNIAYSTSGYVSAGATSMQFTVHVRVEAI